MSSKIGNFSFGTGKRGPMIVNVTCQEDRAVWAQREDVRKVMSDQEKKPRSPEDLQKDLREFLKGKLDSGVFVFPQESEPEESEPPADAEKQKKAKVFEALRFDLTPAKVKRHLDRFVIGL